MNVKRILCAFLCAASLGAGAAPSGPYLSYLGNGVGDGGTAEFSNFIGATAGGFCLDVSRSGFYGAMAGYSTWELYGVNALGFRSLGHSHHMTNVFAVGTSSARNACEVNDSVFIGANAGRNSSGLADCLFVGAGAGRNVSCVTGRVDVCGLVYADRASGDFKDRVP